ncbi:SsrA-binding protein SmpB [Candidatus Parcubacteria bacterium]|nr:SsrA-binding protein SmpB [Candidatus Parcubacteria bacterium]
MTVFADNRRAHFDYEFLETFTAGIELTGAEVKAARAGKISLAGSYVSIRGGEAFLLGAEVQPYQPKNEPLDFDGTRAKKLLLTKDEIAVLAKAEETKGLTIVPLKVYNKGRFLKVDVALARGKKQFDKRQAIKKRDTERDIKRSLTD